MNRIFKLVLVMVLAFSVFTITGCGNKKEESNTVEISYTIGKGVFTVSVPKDEKGNPKYEFTTEKPKGITTSGSVYLVTDTAMFAFSTDGWTYQTSKDYKEKYGEKTPTFDGYLEFIEDKDLFNKSYLPGLEQLEINGRKALRYYNRSGGSGDYDYYGYFYMVAVDDVYSKSRAKFTVNYIVDKQPKESKEFDKETLDIIKSLKITKASSK